MWFTQPQPQLPRRLAPYPTLPTNLRLRKCAAAIERSHRSDTPGFSDQAASWQQQAAGVQVAANPDVDFVSSDDVDPEYLAAELEAELRKEDLASKPEAMRPKIAQGRVDKAVGKKCLLTQEFIKDSGKTVEQVVQEAIVQLKENIKVRRFVRFNLGEGIEKKADDFAAEVAAQTGQA